MSSQPYIRNIEIKGIRSLDQLSWTLPNDLKQATGWHVILGNNGAGKSTFLKSIALTLMAHSQIHGLRQDWRRWLKAEHREGSIRIENFPTSPTGQLQFILRKRINVVQPGFTVRSAVGVGVEEEIGTLEYAESFDNFVMGFGAFRRFTAGNFSVPQDSTDNTDLDRYLSLFDEAFAFGRPLEWLKLLKFRALESGSKTPDLLCQIQTFINQPGFLPFGTQLYDVSSEAVMFRDGNGADVSMLELSDGFRSVLCLTLELIRQLSEYYGPKKIFDRNNPCIIKAPGVVLIDEIDVHLHPSWQRQIGPWLCKLFPKIQFFVTTHSPLICQAAKFGTVFSLPEPGEPGEGRMVTGVELDRLLYGNVLEAYGTEAFDMGTTRSERGQDLLHELAALNIRQVRHGLSEKESRRQIELRAMFPTASYPGSQNGAADS